MTSGTLITNKGNTPLRSVRQDIARESGGFIAAEFTSMGVSLGVVAFMDKVLPKSLMDKVTDIVSKLCIEPYLDTIEKNLARCRLEECQVDETKTRQERAHRLANAIVVFGTAYGIALATKFRVRDYVNEKNGIIKAKTPIPTNLLEKIKSYVPFMGYSKDARIIAGADEAIHIGSLIYMNTKASQFTDEHINKLTSTLEKLGVGHEKAKEISTMVMVWEVPNLLGMMAGGTAIAGKHIKGWGLEGHPTHKVMDVIKGTEMHSPITRS